MTKQISFTKIENEVRPMFRERLNHCESTEDVKKEFVYAVTELLHKVLENAVEIRYEDVALDLASDDCFSVSDGLKAKPEFAAAWEGSDLPRIMRGLAEVARKHYEHLDKNPTKTEAKMYPNPGQAEKNPTKTEAKMYPNPGQPRK
jgi:hypothetical protein